MSKAIRFGSAISVVALATVIGGCAAPQQRTSSVSSQPSGEVGLASRALAALAANDPATAVGFAERAVQRTPGDATIRALLGNAYFAAGRFASAESAFKDSLSIESNQPNVVLKLALAEIAQGKNGDASALLESGRGLLDPADYGLALALAGRPADAIAALEPIARAEGAEPRARQNLALAYAFSGDWTNAKAIAGQDVPADQLDARMKQWMQLATPARPSDQVAALIGVTPAAADPGQPTQLALNHGDSRLAQAAPTLAPAPVAQVAPAPQLAEAAPPPPPVQITPGDEPLPVAAAEVPSFPAFAPAPPPPRVAKPARVVRAKLPKAAVRRATGNSGAVVQLGSFGNADRVAAAWNASAKRFGALKAYTPMSARYDSGKGTFYRLSVKGFGSVGEANALCASVRRGGGSCFVRRMAGDAPVQFASR
ncbi:MAG TPA: tetratricopeptide repeat protein [Sphingomicrobium sp.]